MIFCGELGYSFDLSEEWEYAELLRAKAGEECCDAFRSLVNQANMFVFVDSLNNLDAFELVYAQNREQIREKGVIFEEDCDYDKKIAVIKARDDKNDKFEIFCFFEIAKGVLGHIVLEVRELVDADVLNDILKSWKKEGEK